jgi:hypothetical protein
VSEPLGVAVPVPLRDALALVDAEALPDGVGVSEAEADELGVRLPVSDAEALELGVADSEADGETVDVPLPDALSVAVAELVCK